MKEKFNQRFSFLLDTVTSSHESMQYGLLLVKLSKVGELKSKALEMQAQWLKKIHNRVTLEC